MSVVCEMMVIVDGSLLFFLPHIFNCFSLYLIFYSQITAKVTQCNEWECLGLLDSSFSQTSMWLFKIK